MHPENLGLNCTQMRTMASFFLRLLEADFSGDVQNAPRLRSLGISGE